MASLDLWDLLNMALLGLITEGSTFAFPNLHNKSSGGYINPEGWSWTCCSDLWILTVRNIYIYIFFFSLLNLAVLSDRWIFIASLESMFAVRRGTSLGQVYLTLQLERTWANRVKFRNILQLLPEVGFWHSKDVHFTLYTYQINASSVLS